MKVLSVYDSSDVNSLCAAAVATSRYRGSSNVLDLLDTAGMNSVAIDNAIDAILVAHLAYYNRVLVHCFDAGYANPPAGHLIAADITLLDTAIDTTDPVSDAATTCIPTVTAGTYAPVLAWSDYYGTLLTPAKVIFMMGQKNTYTVSGTASGGTAHTLVDAGSGWTVNAYVGLWVGIISGTGAGKVFKILSNTADTLTVDGEYKVYPSGTSVYQICNRQELCLASEYFGYAALTYLSDLSDGDVCNEWYNLLDVDGLSLQYQRKSPYQDNQRIENYLAIGKNIFDYTLI